MSKYKLDIFKILDRITAGDLTFLDNLSEEDQKGFEAYVAFLWLKGAQQNEEYRYLLSNEALNPYIFALGKHPKLLYKLMCVSHGLQDGCRYRFNRVKGKASTKVTRLLMDYYGYSKSKAVDALPLLDSEALIDIATALGYDDKEIKEILTEFEKE